MKNLMEQIEKVKVNPRYDAKLEDFQVIRDSSPDITSYIFNSFSFGYMRGYKAALAEIKNKAVAR